MQNVVGIFQNNDGTWDLNVENGKLVYENIYESYLKHNFLCFGRADKNIISIPDKRRGCIVSVANNREYFSQAWMYYLNGSITAENIQKIIQEMNKACERDLQSGLIDKNISIQNVVRLDKNKLQFNYVIANEKHSTIIVL